MTSLKKITASLPIEAQFFYEVKCSICRYTFYNVMLPLQIEGYIRIRTFEIKANASTPEVNWFNKYSAETKEKLTPTVRLVERIFEDYKIIYHPYHVLHLWEEKEDELTESDKAIAEKLKEQIVESCEKYKRRVFEPYHDIKRKMKIFKQGVRSSAVGNI